MSVDPEQAPQGFQSQVLQINAYKPNHLYHLPEPYAPFTKIVPEALPVLASFALIALISAACSF